MQIWMATTTTTTTATATATATTTTTTTTATTNGLTDSLPDWGFQKIAEVSQARPD